MNILHVPTVMRFHITVELASDHRSHKQHIAYDTCYTQLRLVNQEAVINATPPQHETSQY